jgi:hypothetical protein
MSIYKRVAGNLIIETIGSTDSVTFQGLTANAATVIIDGDLSVTGNASLLGNIAGDRIFNGTTEIEIPTPSGNAAITVGGVSDIAVFTNTGAGINGTLSVNGNIVSGNILGENINTGGNVFVTRDASAGQPTIRFLDTDIEATDGQIFGAVEWFTSDLVPGPRVTAAVRAIASGDAGNSIVQILTSTAGAAPTPKVSILSTGLTGIGNTAPNHLVSVGGNAYVANTLTVIDTATAGNVTTAGSVSATGTVTGGNLSIGNNASVVGTVSAGNVSVSGGVTAGALGISTTGNVTGGNVVSDGAISATGDISAPNFIASETVSAAGNVIANNVSVTNNIDVPNVVISGSSSGNGVGVENTIWQNTAPVIEPDAVANVGTLGFTALANQSYKFNAVLPVTPEGSTTATFALLFDSGACNYVVEAQETATSIFSAAASNTSDDGITQTMTGTNLRFVRISGTFFHTGNVDIAVRASTSAANLIIASGAYLSYTRIA